MKIALGSMALLLCGCNAADSYMKERKAQEAVAKLLIDPSSAAFMKVEVRSGHVCGLVNGKNRTGAYVGFKKFVVDMSGWKATIDPELDYGDLLSARELCTSLQGNSYASVSTTVSACDRASELAGQQLLEEQFSSTWNAHCEASARLPFQPPLGNITGAAPESANDVQTTPDISPADDMNVDQSNVMNVDMNATDTDSNEVDE